MAQFPTLPGLSLDLPGIFNAAANFRRQRLQEQQMQQIMQAQQAFAQGDPRQLQAVDPLQLQRIQTERARQQQIQQEAAQAQENESANARRFYARALRSGANPEMVVGELSRLGALSGLEEALSGAQSVDDLVLILEGSASAQLGAEQPQQITLSEAGKRARERNFSPGTPEFIAEVDRQQKLINQERVRQQKAGATNLVINPNDLQKTVQKDLQTRITSGEMALSRINSIMEKNPEDFLTLGGRTKAAVGEALDLIGSDFAGFADFSAKRRVFDEEILQLFNEYRSLITGAAASDKELERLRKAMLNPGLGPKAFRASANRFLTELQRNMRIARKFLREGIDLGTEEGGKKLDSAFATGSDAKSTEDILSRRKELLEAGLTDVDVYGQLATEGYITPQQAARAINRLGFE